MLICGDALAFPLADRSVNMIAFSPPYWGQRVYDGCPPTIWPARTPAGMDLTQWLQRAACVHEWRPDAGTQGNNRNFIDAGGRRANNPDISGCSETCRICGAWHGHMGLEPTVRAYIDHLMLILNECWRVLRDDGLCWVNLGDTYSGQRVRPDATRKSYRRDRRHREDLHRACDPTLKPKDLALIPHHFPIAAQEAGWWARRDIIWAKLNPMPESTTTRPATAHEYIWMLAKSGTPQYWVHREHTGTRRKPKPDYRWVHAVTGAETAVEPEGWRDQWIKCPRCQGTGWCRVMIEAELFGEPFVGPRVECRNCKPENSHEVRLLQRINLWRGRDYFYDAEAVREQGVWPEGTRGGKGSRTRCRETKVNSRPPEYAIYTGSRSCRSVWHIATQAYVGAHFATWPEKLAERMIRAASAGRNCPHCGAPWERVVERTKTEPTPNASAQRAAMHRKSKVNILLVRYQVSSRTSGFRATCDCAENDGSGRGLVLDPFVGTGTTVAVAAMLGRQGIGIDRSMRYLTRQAQKRVRLASLQKVGAWAL